MKNITKFLMVAVVLSGFAGLTENAVFAQRKPVITISSKSSEKSAEALVENSEVIVKVVGVRDSVSGENEFVKPNAGNKFIAVQVVIDNTNGLEDWEVIPNYFKLKDLESNTFEPTFLTLVRPALNDGIVDAGDLVKGWITFEISKEIDIKTLKFRYEYNGYAADNYKSGWIFLSAVK